MSQPHITKAPKATKKVTGAKPAILDKYVYAKASKPTPRFPSPVRTSPFRTVQHVNPGELQAFSPSTGDAQMTLEQFMGKPAVASIIASGQLRFHAVGDTGVGSPEQEAVAEAMAHDLAADIKQGGPAFMLNTGGYPLWAGQEGSLCGQVLSQIRRLSPADLWHSRKPRRRGALAD